MRIPLWIEAGRLKVLIFGGGSVGTRRAKFFASAGASVRVIAKDASSELESLGVEIIRADLYKYDPIEDIRWADIVVIALNDKKLADMLYEKATSLGVLVNDATDAERTHVVVPYERRIGGLRVAVTSEGAAGTPARLSLDVVEECINKSWIPHFYEVYSQLKKEAKKEISDAKTRLRFYEALWQDEKFRECVMMGDAAGALARGREILKTLKSQSHET
ncbi:MAG: bifunctional precorrin-2 dehydrogenase/sirohydrochlorin ferrochelatase [Pyrobaculum sp.]